MLLYKDGAVEKTSKTKHISNEWITIYWEGMIFLPGYPEGEKSMISFIKSLDPLDSHSEIMKRVNKLCGSWSIFIYNVKSNTWFAVSDSEHTDSLYYTNDCLSNSFLKLRDTLEDKSALNETAVASVLYCGLNYSKYAFYENIKKLDFKKYILINGSKIKVFNKQLESIFKVNSNKLSYITALDTLFGSLKNHKICLDLTGGTDSRSLAIGLHYLGYDFETATKGSTNYSEVVTAKTVAAILNKPHQSMDLALDDIKPEILKSAWIACDGHDLTFELYLFDRWRSQFGYTLVVNGVSGELYKDGGWFFQGLLFILRTNGIEKFIKRLVYNGYMHWAGGLPKSFVSDRYLSLIMDFLRNTVEVLVEKYGKYPLIEAADRIFNEYSTNIPMGTGNFVINRFLLLNEREMMKVGINQPLYLRINHMMYRRQIGKLNIEAARIPTDRQGLTISPYYRDLASDFYKYSKTALRYLTTNKLKNYKSENKNKQVTDTYLLNHEDTKAAYENLQDRKILNDSFQYQKIDPIIAKRILILHYMFQE